VLDKRHVLAVSNDTPFNYDKKYEGTAKAFYAIDTDNAPHWNLSTRVEWEPTEVYVIECIPPENHPYSKRVIYMDTHDPVVYMGDCYDKAGNYWKFLKYTMAPWKGYDGYYAIITLEGLYLDFKQQHGSIHYAYEWHSNPPGLKETDVNLAELRKAGG
jgi:hypothetical protein